MKDWRIEIDNQPVKISGHMMKVGNYQLGFQNGKDGPRIQFNAETTPDIDRKIQNMMYNQPKLEKWAIMYEASQESVATSFQSNLKECIATFKFNCTPPRAIKLNNKNDWIPEIRKLGNGRDIG